jgi:hypothetical protein
MSTGSRSSPGSADGAPLRSSSCRSARPNTTRSRHSMPAQTTTSPSRSGWPSSSPGCAPPSDAPGPRRHPRGPRAAGRSPHPGCLRGPQRRAAKGPHGRLRDRSAAKQATPDGDEIRLTPTEWGIVEALVRNKGPLVTQQQLLRPCGDLNTARRPNTCGSTWPTSAASWSPIPPPTVLPHRTGHGLPVHRSDNGWQLARLTPVDRSQVGGDSAR